MQIEYKSKEIMKICTNACYAEKRHGREMAGKIHQRIDQIAASDSVEELIRFKIGKCHRLEGDRKNQYAMSLSKNYRLIFETKEREVVIAKIMEIVDYH